MRNNSWARLWNRNRIFTTSVESRLCNIYWFIYLIKLLLSCFQFLTLHRGLARKHLTSRTISIATREAQSFKGLLTLSQKSLFNSFPSRDQWLVILLCLSVVFPGARTSRCWMWCLARPSLQHRTTVMALTARPYRRAGGRFSSTLMTAPMRLVSNLPWTSRLCFGLLHLKLQEFCEKVNMQMKKHPM